MIYPCSSQPASQYIHVAFLSCQNSKWVTSYVSIYNFYTQLHSSASAAVKWTSQHRTVYDKMKMKDFESGNKCPLEHTQTHMQILNRNSAFSFREFIPAKWGSVILCRKKSYMTMLLKILYMKRREIMQGQPPFKVLMQRTTSGIS